MEKQWGKIVVAREELNVVKEALYSMGIDITDCMGINNVSGEKNFRYEICFGFTDISQVYQAGRLSHRISEILKETALTTGPIKAPKVSEAFPSYTEVLRQSLKDLVEYLGDDWKDDTQVQDALKVLNNPYDSGGRKILLRYVMVEGEPKDKDFVYDVREDKVGQMDGGVCRYFELRPGMQEYMQKEQYVLMGYFNFRFPQPGEKLIRLVMVECDYETQKLMQEKFGITVEIKTPL